MGTLVDKCKRLDPTGVWQSLGFATKKSGLEVRVYDTDEEGQSYCVYRSSPDKNGFWISGPADAGTGPIAPGVGDTISVVQHFKKKSFTGAMEYIFRVCRGAQEQRPARIPKKFEEPVHDREAEAAASLYLRGRGISRNTFLYALSRDFLRCRPDGILFMGRENRHVRLAAFRSFEGNIKKDLPGSDKTFVPVLTGDSSTVVIVEGGVNALSVREMCLRHNEPVPTVIVSCGAGNRLWRNNADIMHLLEHAERIVLAMDNDFHLSPERQKTVTNIREKQMSGIEYETWFPAGEANDVNDMLCMYPEKPFFGQILKPVSRLTEG